MPVRVPSLLVALILLVLLLLTMPASVLTAQDPSSDPPSGTDADDADDPEAATGDDDGEVEAPPADAGVQVVRNVVYRRLPGVATRHTSLDVYAPRGGEKRPVVVYVHGGGWKAGDKSRVHRKPALFNGVGWVFVSINYRLLPAGRHPNNVQDVAAALAWVKANIERYRGDPDRVLLIGHSAGAHLVALVASDPRHLKEFDCDLSLLKAVVPLDTGSYDIPWQVRQNSRQKARMVDAFGTDDADVWADASPLHFLTEDGDYAPWLLISSHGRAQGLEQGRKVAEVLRAAGGEADVFEARGKNHGAVNQDLGTPGDEMTQRVMTHFFRALELDVPDRFRVGEGASDDDGESSPARPARPFREIVPELNLNAAQLAQLRGLVRRYRGRYDDPAFDRALQMVLTAEQYTHLMRELGRDTGDDEDADDGEPDENDDGESTD